MKWSSLGLRRTRWCAFLLSACLGVAEVGFCTPITLYSTEFEAAEGFNADFDLAGQNGWTNEGTGGNGLLAGEPGSGQSAYIGYGPLTTDGLFLWRPIDHNPTNRPMVTVTLDMLVADSTTTNRDEFRWSVYNIAGIRLFSLIFDNRDLGIYHQLDDDEFRFNGFGFTNEAVYSVRIQMDFAGNLWSAWIGGMQIITNEFITTTNASLTFGDADAVWLRGAAAGAGDNFMIFDNLAIAADVTSVPAPVMRPPLAVVGGLYVIRVDGAEGARIAVEASTDLQKWTALKTNIITGGYFDHLDTTAAGLPMRFYRARGLP